MTEQFEQAKREFAYKHTTPDMSRIEEGFVPSEDNMNALLSDLNSLLEQHKEVILKEELIKYDEWVFEHGKAFADTKESVNQYLEELKNAKK